MDNFLVICLNNAFSSFLFADGFSLGGLLLGLFDLFEVGFGWVRLNNNRYKSLKWLTSSSTPRSSGSSHITGGLTGK
jgi:hypothetical protein